MQSVYYKLDVVIFYLFQYIFKIIFSFSLPILFFYSVLLGRVFFIRKPRHLFIKSLTVSKKKLYNEVSKKHYAKGEIRND